MGEKVPHHRPAVRAAGTCGVREAPLPCGAGGCAEQAQEGGPAAGAGRDARRGPVYVTRQGDGRRSVAEKAAEVIGHLASRPVRVEREVDPPAAPQGCGDALCALCAERGAGRKAPPGDRGPVEDDPRTRMTQGGRERRAGPTRAPALLPGRRLEPVRGAVVYGPCGHPARGPTGGVGDDDHAGEAFTACSGEQARAAETLGAEYLRIPGGPAGPLPAHSRARDGRPRRRRWPGKARYTLWASRRAPKLANVVPHRRGERRRRRERTPVRRATVAQRPHPARTLNSPRDCSSAYRPGESDSLHPLDEVQHVTPGPAAKAPPALRVGVDGERSPGPRRGRGRRPVGPCPLRNSSTPAASTVSPRGCRLLTAARSTVAEAVIDRLRPAAECPRTARRDTTWPGCHRIPIAAATFSMSVRRPGRNTAPRPVPWRVEQSA